MKLSIEMSLFDGLELQEFEDELKHLIRDECKKAPEPKVRSITLKHSLFHIECIKKPKRQESLCLTRRSCTQYTVAKDTPGELNGHQKKFRS